MGPGVTTSCRTTQDCRGGSFCDRGSCAATDTQVFGHGYGAQCLPEAAYPSPQELTTHCRGRSCIDGHCSSCNDDSECTQAGQRCVVQPGVGGKTCEINPVDRSKDREDQRAELPPTTLLKSEATECTNAADCKGDEFCDRGRCSTVMVDAAGHGFGAFCKRVEAPNQSGTCFAYLCVNNYCSSCLGDAECYSEAPFCIESPLWPNGKVCAPEPASHWYGEDGKLRAEREAERDEAIDFYRRLQSWRAMVGLPVDPRYAE